MNRLRHGLLFFTGLVVPGRSRAVGSPPLACAVPLSVHPAGLCRGPARGGAPGDLVLVGNSGMSGLRLH